MKSILFAILVVISVNIQSTEAQPKEPVTERANQAEEPVTERADKAEEPVTERANQAEEPVTERANQAEGAKGTALQPLKEYNPLEIETTFNLLAKALGSQSDHLFNPEVLLRPNVETTMLLINKFRKEFLAELRKAVIGAIGTGNVKEYKVLSALMKRYGYNEYDMITLASLIQVENRSEYEKQEEMFSWLQMLIKAPLEKEFFTEEMIRILLLFGININSDIALFSVYLEYVGALKKTAKEAENRPAFTLLDVFDRFLNNMHVMHNNKNQGTQRVFLNLLRYYKGSTSLVSASVYGGVSATALALGYNFLSSLMSVVDFIPPEVLANPDKVVGSGLTAVAVVAGVQAASICIRAFKRRQDITKKMKALNNRN